MPRDTEFTRPSVSPVQRLSEPEWWQLPTDFDPDKVLAAARAERDEVLARYVRALGLGRALRTLWRTLIAEPFKRWRQRERWTRELTMMQDYELHDIGITRSMIPYIVSGKVAREDQPARRDRKPANENTRSREAA